MTPGFNEDGLVLSENYAETMNGTVLPFLRSIVKPVTVKGAGEKPVAVYRYDAESPKGTVMMVHGFTECAEKFSELIYSLIRQGYSVLALDQRGHGASWRDEHISDISLTHVDRFEEYVEDLKAVCDQVLSKMPKPWFVFSHSMGGAVTCMLLENHPGIFEKAVFCAPMIAPNRGGIPMAVSKAMCLGAKALGKKRKRIFISRPFSGPEDFETSCASGRERFDWYDEIRVKTEKYQNNGPTYGWTLESLRVTGKLLAPGKPERITIPVVIYTAEDDNSVLPDMQEQLASRLPDGSRKLVPGSRHEIYRSPDEVLFPWWHEILAFYG